MLPEFRNATVNDIDVLNRVSIASKKYWSYPDHWIEQWRNDLTIHSGDLDKQSMLILEVENEIIGFCAIAYKDKNYEIEHLWIVPEYIGKGYGNLLLNRSIEKFVKNKHDIIVVADPNAEAFYLKNGFITFDTIESYPKGRMLPVMKKSH